MAIQLAVIQAELSKSSSCRIEKNGLVLKISNNACLENKVSMLASTNCPWNRLTVFRTATTLEHLCHHLEIAFMHINCIWYLHCVIKTYKQIHKIPKILIIVFFFSERDVPINLKAAISWLRSVGTARSFITRRAFWNLI